MSERLPVGSEVLRVEARDPDVGAALQYELAGPVLARDRTGVALSPEAPYDYQGAFRLGTGMQCYN